MNLSPESIIAFLNAQPPEAIMAIELLLCYSAVLVMLRLFGQYGLYAYIAIGVIGANIEVLKPVQFSLYHDPVALGTILFTSTYLTTDILAQHYGRPAAQRAIYIGFASYLIFIVMMMATLGYRPLSEAEAGSDLAWSVPNHGHMAALFLPSPALFAASMISYLVSQNADVWIFQLVRRFTGEPHLWLRNNLSTLVSALLDNTVFSTLAWVVFAADPIGWRPLIFTYILGTYLLRVVISVLDTPFMYLSKIAVRPHLAGATSRAYA